MGDRHKTVTSPLGSAVPGSFALAPHDAMTEQLRVDFRAIQSMIFDDPPNFEAVLDSIRAADAAVRPNACARCARKA